MDHQQMVLWAHRWTDGQTDGWVGTWVDRWACEWTDDTWMDLTDGHRDRLLSTPSAAALDGPVLQAGLSVAPAPLPLPTAALHHPGQPHSPLRAHQPLHLGLRPHCPLSASHLLPGALVRCTLGRGGMAAACLPALWLSGALLTTPFPSTCRRAAGTPGSRSPTLCDAPCPQGNPCPRTPVIWKIHTPGPPSVGPHILGSPSPGTPHPQDSSTI